jgi:hypothetical protein
MLCSTDFYSLKYYQRVLILHPKSPTNRLYPYCCWWAGLKKVSGASMPVKHASLAEFLRAHIYQRLILLMKKCPGWAHHASVKRRDIQFPRCVPYWLLPQTEFKRY